jgi:1,4-alpha-glucan branching enzyme
MHELDSDPNGFEWVDCNDMQTSSVSLLRKSSSGKGTILVACNFTPIPRTEYRVGVPTGGFWRELLNSDAIEYGGSGWGNMGGKQAEAVPEHGRPYSLNLTLPPLSVVFLQE